MGKRRRVFEQGHGRKFLLIVDETPEVESALYYAAGRLSHTGGSLSLLYVIEPETQFWASVRQAHLEEQTTKAMECIKLILDEVGASFKDIVKITKYLTDMRDADGMNKAMKPYMGDWRPASTMVCVNQLSSPGARIELDCIVAIPKSAKR